MLSAVHLKPREAFGPHWVISSKLISTQEGLMGFVCWFVSLSDQTTHHQRNFKLTLLLNAQQRKNVFNDNSDAMWFSVLQCCEKISSRVLVCSLFVCISY